MRDLAHLTGRRILVQIDDGSTVAGTLSSTTRRTATLADATLVMGDREIPIDGEVVVFADRVTWVQVP